MCYRCRSDYPIDFTDQPLLRGDYPTDLTGRPLLRADCVEQPAYPDLSEAVKRYRRRAQGAGSFAALPRDEIIAYGEAVGEAIRALQRQEAARGQLRPLPAPYPERTDKAIAARLTRQSRAEARARCGRPPKFEGSDGEPVSTGGWRNDASARSLYCEIMAQRHEGAALAACLERQNCL